MLPADSFDFYFNPRSLTGATCRLSCLFTLLHISIHAPLRERCIYMITNTITNISIHAPLRERIRYLCADGTWKISIHAPLRERQQPQMFPTQMSDFNPRSLTGATTTLVVKTRSSGFQSTLPYGSDVARYVTKKLNGISIHAPLRERTPNLLIVGI